jgi:Fe-S-cluster containining protein
MKKEILHHIYNAFERWPNRPAVACRSGCSACCSGNVTITALEGVEILRWVQQNSLSHWLARILAENGPGETPRQTTNEFAAACLAGLAEDDPEEMAPSSCPFLENSQCRIYPVRPLACRLFVSSQTCEKGQPALVPEYYLATATVLCQLVEHLGQKEYWGNMLNVLPALLDSTEFGDIAAGVPSLRTIQARLATRKAHPLPGFLLTEAEEEKIRPLLATIFSIRVAGRRIEDILNGR